MRTTALRPRNTLVSVIQHDLRRRISEGQFVPGARLPGEVALAREYSVHRSTVRGALQELASAGLIETRHGAGSYVLDAGMEIRAGLQQLRSMSETIREMGHEPGMSLHSLEKRAATDEERRALDLTAAMTVLDLRRTVLADGDPVAFSYDVFPAGLFPEDVLPRLGTGSVYQEMRLLGVEPVRAVARVNAVSDPTIGWGEHTEGSSLFLLLDQIHSIATGRRVVWSRTYFVEGAFQFYVLRTR